MFGLNPRLLEIDATYLVYPSVVTATTSLSGKELSYSLNFPQKSIAGLPVIECAEFGRNITTYNLDNLEQDKLSLGYIFHMNHQENTPVWLSKNSLASHVFVTGSTGSGKSNTVYQILNESMEYSLMAGGKRLRPILVIATYELFEQNIEKCLPYAVAIEMVHNFSLIHDDLPGIDNDDFRHGKPTNHKKYNEATAILAGDGLLNNAYIVLSKDLENTEDLEELKTKIKLFNEFSLAIDRMIAGEYVDTEYEGKEISENYLEYIHLNKTGALLTLSVRMGAILANVDKKTLEDLTNYASKIGLAFQIKDDILSEEGNEEVLGKPVGNDKKLGKCTYVSKYGLDGAKEKLRKITEEAIDIITTYGERAEFLKELAIYIANRNK